MNAQQIANFIDNATAEQKAVFNNNAQGLTIADTFEGSISHPDRQVALEAANSIQSVSITAVNSYADKATIKDVPC